MSDIHGPITHATIASGLWALPLAPLLAAAFALYAYLLPALHRKPRAKPDVSVAAALASAFVVAWSIFQVLKLAQLPEADRFLLEHVFRMVRVGQLDVAMDLAFDPLTSVLVLTAATAALFVFLVARAHAQKVGSAFFGWSSLLFAATLLVLLADGLVVAFIGWELAAVAGWGLVRLGDEPRARRGFVIARTADGALLVATALLFWGLGGLWVDHDYTPDLTPRFAVVRLGEADGDDKKEEAEEHKEPVKGGGKGFISMNAYPGALIFMDDSRTPVLNGDVPLRAPFTRFEIASGMHSFRIHPGSGIDDYLISHVSVAKNKEVTFSVFGATVTFAQMRDQLVSSVPREETAPRVALAGKRGGLGVSLVTLVAFLFFFAAAARSGQLPIDGWLDDAARAPPLAGALVAAIAPLVAPYLLARLGPVLVLSGPGSGIVGALGGATAALGGWRAARAVDLRRVVACLGAVQLGLATIGAAVGAPAAAALVLVVYTPGAAALWICVFLVENARGTTDVRHMGGLRARMPGVSRAFFVVAGAMSVLAPGLSGFWAANATLAVAFAARSVAVVPGWALFALGAAGVFLSSFALFRAYLVVFEGKAVKERDAGDVSGMSRLALAGLTLLGAVGGVVLGAGGSLFSARGTTVIGEWVEPFTEATAATFAPLGKLVPWGLATILVGVAFGGFSVARARYAPGKRKDDWAEREPAPETPSPPRKGALALANIAAGAERWVWDGVYAFAAFVVRAAAFVASLLEERILGVGIDAIGERAARLDARARAIGAAACVAAIAAAVYLALGRRL
jgi:NADH:ubiquinone oxidoreductase subunit 5 (subunit L)/multisubunit Na+/H+ antiporter MnhA subunit